MPRDGTAVILVLLTPLFWIVSWASQEDWGPQQEWMLPGAGLCPLKAGRGGRVSTGPSCQASQHHS